MVFLHNFHDYFHGILGDFESIGNDIEIWFCMTIFDLLGTFDSVFVQIAYTGKMLLTY